MAELAIAARLPVVYGFREHVEAGGLMSYGVDLRETWRRAAAYWGCFLALTGYYLLAERRPRFRPQRRLGLRAGRLPVLPSFVHPYGASTTAESSEYRLAP